MKVFITGIGSDIGTSIARSLEHDPKVTEIAGIDLYPPRRYLGRSKFRLYSIGENEKISDFLNEFQPDVLVNFGLYEPGSRLDLRHSRYATETILSGIEEFYSNNNSSSVRLISRSSIVVYGFSNPEHVLDETSPVNPDTDYGEICCEVEERLRKVDPQATFIRSAPEIGAHVPHPLARVLLQPWIPVQIRLPFSKDIGIPVTSPRDTVEIFLKCIFDDRSQSRIFHSVSNANFTIYDALRIGNRIPLFSSGIGFGVLKKISYFSGAPIDDHIEMFLRRGMRIDSTATRMHFKITSTDSSKEILKNLYGDIEKVIDNPTGSEVSK